MFLSKCGKGNVLLVLSLRTHERLLRDEGSLLSILIILSFTDEVYVYLGRMPQFATRATLFSAECLRGRGLYGEAAKLLIRMTSEDSDLRSALLLEQAAYCFLASSRPPMPRKYAFHLVLAGHRFSKAGQKRHSLRCYRQAYQVSGSTWSPSDKY